MKLLDSRCITCFYYAGDEITTKSLSKPNMETVDFNGNKYAFDYSLKCTKVDMIHQHIITEEGYYVPNVHECSDFYSKGGGRGRICRVEPDKGDEWNGFFHKYLEIDDYSLALIENRDGQLVKVKLYENNIYFLDEETRIDL